MARPWTWQWKKGQHSTMLSARCGAPFGPKRRFPAAQCAGGLVELLRVALQCLLEFARQAT